MALEKTSIYLGWNLVSTAKELFNVGMNGFRT